MFGVGGDQPQGGRLHRRPALLPHVLGSLLRCRDPEALSLIVLSVRYAMIVILNLALHEGVKTVVMPKFDLVDFLKLAQALHLSVLTALAF